jgi:carbon-monoxide dehydrogenase medium subunit
MLFPKTVEEAVALFAAGDAAIVCGGTAHALRRERSGYPFARRLIAIGRIPELNRLSFDAGGALTMGAAVNQERLYVEPRIRGNWQAIDDALEGVGHTRIRRMITVGGSIGPLIGGFDLPIALLALATRVAAAGPQGRRTLSLEEAFERRFAKDEIVTHLEVAPLPSRTGSSFFKYMPRAVLEIPTVNTAARVSLDEKGRCASARVVVGAVSWKPIVLDLDFAGRRLEEKLIREAVQKVRSLASPMADVRGSAAYKHEMAVEFAARAVVRAWERAGK